MCTREGIIKKTSLEAYSRPRTNGVNAITIKDGDELLEARLTSGRAQIILAAKCGKSIRFEEQDVRAIGRTGAGVRGMSLDEGDNLIGMLTIEPDEQNEILVVSENGYGKRTDIEDYRIQSRSGKGVKTIQITEKTGKLISIQSVSDQNDLMIITRSGVTIRMPVGDIRLTGRAAQGVKVINLRGDDSIASVTAIPKTEEVEEIAVVVVDEALSDDQTVENNE